MGALESVVLRWVMWARNVSAEVRVSGGKASTYEAREEGGKEGEVLRVVLRVVRAYGYCFWSG